MYKVVKIFKDKKTGVIYDVPDNGIREYKNDDKKRIDELVRAGFIEEVKDTDKTSKTSKEVKDTDKTSKEVKDTDKTSKEESV